MKLKIVQPYSTFVYLYDNEGELVRGLQLTIRESQIIQLLISKGGGWLSADEIDTKFGKGKASNNATIQVIMRLRKKLGFGVLISDRVDKRVFYKFNGEIIVESEGRE